MNMTGRLFDKVWDRHVVAARPGEPALLFIDLHLVHEVTSPQAFEGLELAGRKVRRPDLTLATMDHDVPTAGLDQPIADPLAAQQVEALKRNCAAHGITLHPLGSVEQGIVHVIGPQLGLTQPGMTIVCGDSHTSTHGAFGALAFGIGTTEVEHVLATQTLRQVKPSAMAGKLAAAGAGTRRARISVSNSSFPAETRVPIEDPRAADLRLLATRHGATLARRAQRGRCEGARIPA
jgi:3-isopropylmalate/(R)-2-methylmalate dehydratase large subunit